MQFSSIHPTTFIIILHDKMYVRVCVCVGGGGITQCSSMAMIRQAWEQDYCEKIQKVGSKLWPSNDAGSS